MTSPAVTGTIRPALPTTDMIRSDDPFTTRLRRLALGLTALALALLILSALGVGAWLLSRRFGGVGPSYPLTVRFADANGLGAGDAVTFAGIDVGRVESVGVKNARAEARLQIANDVRIPQGARFVAVPALFGEAGSVRIVAEAADGADAPPVLAANAPGLTGEATPDIADAFDRVNTVSQQLGRVGTRSERLLDEATGTVREMRQLARDPALRGDVRRTLSEVRTVAHNGAELTDDMARLIDTVQPGTRRTMTEMAGLTREMRGMATEMRTITRNTRPQIAGLLSDTRRTLAAGEKAIGTGEKTIARGAALIPAGPEAAQQVETLLSDLSASVATLRDTTEKVDAAAGASANLLTDPQVAADIKATLAGLRATTEGAQKVMESSKPLTDDPTVARDLRDVLRNTRQVSETSARLLQLLTTAAEKAAKKGK